MRETPPKPFGTRRRARRQSQSDGHGDNPQGRLDDVKNPQRPDVWDRHVNLEAQWVVGFTDGEGRFHVAIDTHTDATAGVQVMPEFTIVQHQEDVQVLHALKAYFGVGVVRTDRGDRKVYRVRKLEHLHDVICPFFMKHKLRTRTHLAFLKFRRVVLMMTRGEHLDREGLEAIQTIAAEMNVRRSR